jgi:hypothetical protein
VSINTAAEAMNSAKKISSGLAGNCMFSHAPTGANTMIAAAKGIATRQATIPLRA